MVFRALAAFWRYEGRLDEGAWAPALLRMWEMGAAIVVVMETEQWVRRDGMVVNGMDDS